MRCAPRMWRRSRSSCASSPRCRPGPGSAAVSGPAKPPASLPGRHCRRAPTRSSSRRTRSAKATASEFWKAPPRGRYVRREGLDFAEGDVLLRAGRRLTARDIGLACGDEPAVALRPSPAADRHPVDRRRDRHAGRPDRAAPDRQLEQPRARRLCRGLRRHAGIGRQRPGRSGSAAPNRGRRRAASICW